MRNLKLTLSYDGTEFFGWQTQPGFRTVQETIEQAILPLNQNTLVHVNASGRTDTGVHAIAQVANVKCGLKMELHRIAKAINSFLPEDVVIRQVEEAPLEFDARRHAMKKTYRYVISNQQVPDLFLRKYSWHYPYARLDDEAMQNAAQYLIGTHDFHSFETHWPNRKSSVRTVHQLSVKRMQDLIWIEVEANGFLYNMARSIVGTLVKIGQGVWPATEMEKILHSEDRRVAGMTAPAQGLFLLKVDYPEVLEPLYSQMK